MRSTLFLVLFISFVFGQFTGKTEVFPDGLSAGLSLDAFIEPVGYTLTVISSTSNCDVSVCDAGTVTAYRANYYDGTLNYICICYDPIMNVDTTADRFGRVVYKVRNSVIGITVASKNLATGGAYSSGDVIRILQDSNTEVFTHEAAHSFDGRNGYSASPAFQAAVAADSCVPDNYAKSSYAEDFGQLIVTWTYIVVSGRQADVKFNCLRNQLAFVRTYLSEADILSIANGTGSLGAPCSQDYECGSYGQNYQYSRCTNGRCRCGPNFSGLGTVSDQCRCDGTVSYTTGTPVCLTPGTCQENWQCYEGSENSNFVSCNASSGRCQCRSGFSGSGTPADKCRCAGTVSWVNGTPFCV